MTVTAPPLQTQKSRLETRLLEIAEFLYNDQLPYFQIVLISAIFLSCFSSYLFFIHDFHVAHFDSKGHLLVPRRLFDSLQPGWIQIGAFWLPFPHILYLPFVQNDYLYFSGLAATPLSMTFFVLTVVFLYKLIETIFDRFAAFCGSTLYLTNGNMLYLQSTPLTENLSLLLAVASVYLFVLFAKEQKRQHLWISSLLSMLAILTRYENWFVFSAQGLLLILLNWKQKRGFKNLILDALILGIPNVAAMGLTFWINWYTTGHAYMDHRFKHTDFQPAQGSFMLAFVVILYTLANLISNEWTIFALIGAFLIFRKKYKDPGFIASLALLGPLLLYLYEYRDNHPTRIRYGIPFVPPAVYFVSYWPGRTRLITFLFIVLTFHVAWSSPFSRLWSSQLLRESIRDAENLAIQKDLLWYLKEHDDGTLILASMGEIAPTFYDLKLPVKRFVHEGVKPYWNDANKSPEKVVGWVFLNQDDRLWKRFHNDPEFHKHFALIGRSGFLELYRYTTDEEFNIRSHKDHATRSKFDMPSLPGV